MKITYYRDPFGGYHGITDVSPKGLAGCVCVGRGPEERGGIESVKERAYAVKHLQKWTRVENVPDDWLEAIGYESVPTEPKTVKLEFKPCKNIIPDEYTKDPLFWALCLAFFFIYYTFIKYLLE